MPAPQGRTNSDQETRSGQSDASREKGRKAAARTIQLIVFLVPAVLGFVIAYSILAVMAPFTSVAEWVLWLFIAVVVSLATSLFIGDGVRNLIRRTPLYRKANNFDTKVEELFGSSLREGSPKNVKRNAIELGHDADFIDEILFLLDQLGRHERLSRGHSERVRAYAALIGKQIGLSEDELELLSWSALMHDIGKLDVPSWLLSSPERPTDEEWEVLKRHPESAVNRLRKLERIVGSTIYDGALNHHERWDGTGYPQGLSETDIPLFGRITAIADTFDVMTHARSYKKPLPIADARKELEKNSGTQFDPGLIAAFLQIGDEDLKFVRGWSATIAGVAVAGSRLAIVGSQATVVAATVAGAGVASTTIETLPPPLAFEEAIPTSTTAPTTTVTPTTTTTVAPTTTTTTTTIATTTTAQRLMGVDYQIGNNTIDDVEVTVEADELQVFLDGELFEIFELADGQRIVPIVFDVTNFAPGVHQLRFDLYLDGVLLSSDQSVIVV